MEKDAVLATVILNRRAPLDLKMICCDETALRRSHNTSSTLSSSSQLGRTLLTPVIVLTLLLVSPH